MASCWTANKYFPGDDRRRDATVGDDDHKIYRARTSSTSARVMRSISGTLTYSSTPCML